jgi:hypothetical protein
MPHARIFAGAVLIGAGLLAAPASNAGPYADDMAKCMVRTSSPADRTVFIRFLFAALAQHPDVAPLAKISPQQLDASLKDTGELIQRLMLQSCRTETEQALRYEGPQTIVYAFQVYGQAMAAELFNNPAVSSKMKDMNKYIDTEKLRKMAEAAAQGPAPAAAPAPAPAPTPTAPSPAPK